MAGVPDSDVGVMMNEREADAGRSTMIRQISQRIDDLWFLQGIRPSTFTSDDWLLLKNIEGTARLLADPPPEKQETVYDIAV